MIKDRNKTPLTREVSAASARWLAEHGFKPIETEVRVQEGWVADLATIIIPTTTELINLKLVPRRPPYGDPVAYAQWETGVKPLKRRLSTVVEVKTTRADFQKDKTHKWAGEPPSALAFLAVPADLIRPEEWPEGWGILEVRGDRVRMLRTAAVREADPGFDAGLFYEIALRRDHFTRHERDREFQRDQRIEQGEKKTMQRVDSLARAMTRILYNADESIEFALSSSGIRIQELRESTVEKIASLRGMRNMPVDGEEEVFDRWWNAVGGEFTREGNLRPNKWRIGAEYHFRREVARVAYMAALREARSAGVTDLNPDPNSDRDRDQSREWDEEVDGEHTPASPSGAAQNEEDDEDAA